MKSAKSIGVGSGKWLTLRQTQALRNAPEAPFLWHLEGDVARKRAGGCYHLDFSAGRANGYGGRD